MHAITKLIIDDARHQQLIRQRAVANPSLTRLQTFIDSGDDKVNKVQVRFDDLPGICNIYDSAQNELELLDDTDHFADRELFEIQYCRVKEKFNELLVKAKFNELLHPVMEQALSRCSSPCSSLLGRSNNSTCSHHSSCAHINLTVIEMLTFEGGSYIWLQFRL